MSISVNKTFSTSSRTSSKIDLFEGVKLPSDKKDQLKDEVGQLLVEQILKSVGSSTSPISGYGKFKGLSKLYKKEKSSEGRGASANLELSGAMLDALSYRPTKTGVEVGVFGVEAPKADGHNNLSGKSELPLRRFLPAEGETFTLSVQKTVDNIIQDALAEIVDIKKSDLTSLETKEDFWNLLNNKYPSLSKTEIVKTITSNTDLFSTILSLGFDKWL